MKLGPIQKPALALPFLLAACSGQNGSLQTSTLADASQADVVAKIMPLAVHIEAYNTLDHQGEIGSGFVIDAVKGFIATNQHVIEGANIIMVTFNDNSIAEAHVVGADKTVDIAVLDVGPHKTGQQAVFAAQAPRRGEKAIAVGSPNNMRQSVTTGVISNTGQVLPESPANELNQTDAAINIGNSGGPLFDGNGQVVGMNTFIMSGSDGSSGLNFAIAASQVQLVTRTLIGGHAMHWGSLGVGKYQMNPEMALSLGLDKTQRGILVKDVEKNSAADRAGVVTGDIILAVNGVDTFANKNLDHEIMNAGAGVAVDLRILRDHKPYVIKVSLDEVTTSLPPHPAKTGQQMAIGPG